MTAMRVWPLRGIQTPFKPELRAFFQCPGAFNPRFEPELVKPQSLSLSLSCLCAQSSV